MLTLRALVRRRGGVRYFQGGRGGGFSPAPFPAPSFSSAERVPWNLGFVIVPQQKAFVVERLGRFSTTLTAGFYFLVPFFDRVAYVHSLKETALSIPSQAAITRDNVTISIDGVLYVRINDPHAASYGVSDPIWALTQLAQTTMRSELGKYSLDRTFSERESLNSAIVTAINDAARSWGIECLRYEIRDINPPASLTQAMSLQAEAERRKRADILESEGRREAAINTAEGQRRSTVLAAQGDAEATLARAHASAAALEMITAATGKRGAQRAVALHVAEKYVAAFGNIAKRGTTVLLPADAGNAGGMVASALSVYKSLMTGKEGGAGGRGEEEEGGGAAPGGSDEVTEKIYNNALRHLRGADGRGNAERAAAAAAVAAATAAAAEGGAGGGRSITSEEAAKRAAGGGGGDGDAFVPRPLPPPV